MVFNARGGGGDQKKTRKRKINGAEGKNGKNETDSALRRRKKMRKSVHRSNAIICFVCTCTCWR